MVSHREHRDKDKEIAKDNIDFLIRNYGPSDNTEIFRKMYVYIRLIDMLKIKTEYTLDLGCGFGTLTKVLSLISKKIDALDFFQESIDVAKKKNINISNINYLCEDIFNYNLETKKYDLVFVSEFHPFTRNYYEDLNESLICHKKIIKNIENSIKDNGHLIISHIPSKAQCIDVLKSIDYKLEIVVFELDERLILLLDNFLKNFVNQKIYFFIIKTLTKIRIILHKLKIIKGIKLIYILKKIN